MTTAPACPYQPGTRWRDQVQVVATHQLVPTLAGRSRELAETLVAIADKHRSALRLAVIWEPT